MLAKIFRKIQWRVLSLNSCGKKCIQHTQKKGFWKRFISYWCTSWKTISILQSGINKIFCFLEISWNLVIYNYIRKILSNLFDIFINVNNFNLYETLILPGFLNFILFITQLFKLKLRKNQCFYSIIFLKEWLLFAPHFW